MTIPIIVRVFLLVSEIYDDLMSKMGMVGPKKKTEILIFNCVNRNGLMHDYSQQLTYKYRTTSIPFCFKGNRSAVTDCEIEYFHGKSNGENL